MQFTLEDPVAVALSAPERTRWGFHQFPALPGDYDQARGDASQYACLDCPVAQSSDGGNKLQITQTSGPCVNLRCFDLTLK